MRMEVAKLFLNGGSQAVRLPKNCRFSGGEVFINRIGNVVILTPKENSWAEMLSSLDLFTDDFLAEGVEDLPVQERETL